MDATQDGITSLVVNANGRSVNVNLGGTSDGAAGTTVEVHQRRLGKNPRNTGNIIDAKFVAKNKD
jgi:hypothetical protein